MCFPQCWNRRYGVGSRKGRGISRVMACSLLSMIFAERRCSCRHGKQQQICCMFPCGGVEGGHGPLYCHPNPPSPPVCWLLFSSPRPVRQNRVASAPHISFKSGGHSWQRYQLLARNARARAVCRWRCTRASVDGK